MVENRGMNVPYVVYREEQISVFVVIAMSVTMISELLVKRWMKKCMNLALSHRHIVAATGHIQTGSRGSPFLRDIELFSAQKVDRIIDYYP